MHASGFLDASPARFRHWSLLVFGLWGAAIWLARVRNILSDTELDGGARALWLVPAIGFGVGGLVVLWAWWKGTGALWWPVMGVAAATILYWPVRTVFILFDGRSMSFRVVHVVLSVLSMGLAALAARRLLRRAQVPRGALL